MSSSASSAEVQRNDDIRSEQAYLTRLYGRLDLLREQADARLRAILLEAGGTPQGRSQRPPDRAAMSSSVRPDVCVALSMDPP